MVLRWSNCAGTANLGGSGHEEYRDLQDERRSPAAEKRLNQAVSF
jgi:hypothetical protein